MKRECGAGICPQCRGCPRNCKRRILRHEPLGISVPGRRCKVLTREPGDLPSAVVTREDVGRGVQTFGFIGRLKGRRWDLVRCDVPLTSYRGPELCLPLVLYDRVASCSLPPRSHPLPPSICLPPWRSRLANRCRLSRCRPPNPASRRGQQAGKGKPLAARHRADPRPRRQQRQSPPRRARECRHPSIRMLWLKAPRGSA
ncbi:hypothetical protein M2232_000757 [Bradyrhizobium japonicum]|nr:hypothetical protein [Bradyrhizobium japonicum]MCW2341839.1 hypothetical protein [Bradyrhizobium japonicum]